MLLYALVPTLPRLECESDPDVENYINQAPISRRENIRGLVESLKDEFPDLREGLKYGMPTFERNGRWIAFSNHRNHLSVYFCEESFVRAFRSKFPEAETGKNCIFLRDKEKFPTAYLRTLLKKTLQQRAKAR
ncbi:DUF1801 domain-containing protein [Leptospira langatensis]|uniref:DUF1801 domain-containing protein n=1 Tax=Leptospira langatensis TaxID=2484983 RepID=A0A5F1ZQW8_9LEPT|nr:DUF1801 domain-containing protein [Leptospira langatensis]TGK02712.1 DUF1801 domain-containing protein [Leptospira langatensis]TGL40085.1 DUF1801 domain-containing protein [Leptospira langatensis]